MLLAITDKKPIVPSALLDKQVSARFIGQHIQLNTDYYMHELFYYAHKFDRLDRIELHATSTYAQQPYMQQVYEINKAMESRKKLSLLSQRPNLCPVKLSYSKHITIFCYDTHYFKTQKCNSGAYSLKKTGILAHPPNGASTTP
jgi:hypothetical protein